MVIVTKAMMATLFNVALLLVGQVKVTACARCPGFGVIPSVPVPPQKTWAAVLV